MTIPVLEDILPIVRQAGRLLLNRESADRIQESAIVATNGNFTEELRQLM